MLTYLKRFREMIRYFEWSFGILLGGMILAFWRGEATASGLGFSFLLTALVISVLEVSLSFDNAVINATKLEKMSHKWRQRFLTWGIAIAVFGMRFVFPIVIVAVFADLPCRTVLGLALHNPDEYARHLEEANVGISSFGGTFLMMLFFEFMFDKNKTLNWISLPEKALRKIGRIKFAPTILTLILLALTQIALGEHERAVSMVAGVSGIIVHLLIHGISQKLEKMAAMKNEFAIKHAGLAAFIYLELIDASFSLDGVLGAFALTKDVVVIAIGLAVGAFFVRSLTIVLVEKKTLEKLLYLTHGAYWAIGALACIMLIATFHEIPEAVTGTLGMFLILASLVSSIRYNLKRRK